MSKIKTQSIIFAAAMIFIILLVASLLYPFDFTGKSINQIHQENSGALWIVTTGIVIAIMVIQHYKGKIMDVIKTYAEDSEIKNEMIVQHQKDSFKRDQIHSEKLTKLTESIANREVWHITNWGKLSTKVTLIDTKVNRHERSIRSLKKKVAQL